MHSTNSTLCDNHPDDAKAISFFLIKIKGKSGTGGNASFKIHVDEVKVIGCYGFGVCLRRNPLVHTGSQLPLGGANTKASPPINRLYPGR